MLLKDAVKVAARSLVSGQKVSPATLRDAKEVLGKFDYPYAGTLIAYVTHGSFDRKMREYDDLVSWYAARCRRLKKAFPSINKPTLKVSAFDWVFAGDKHFPVEVKR